MSQTLSQFFWANLWLYFCEPNTASISDPISMCHPMPPFLQSNFWFHFCEPTHPSISVSTSLTQFLWVNLCRYYGEPNLSRCFVLYFLCVERSRHFPHLLEVLEVKLPHYPVCILSVGWSVGPSIIISQRGERFHFHAHRSPFFLLFKRFSINM